jgi:hypothetical protein
MITVIMIRDFPDFPIGWRDSYILLVAKDRWKCEEAAKIEIKIRGGKYGAVLYESNVEVLQIPRNYKP